MSPIKIKVKVLGGCKIQKDDTLSAMGSQSKLVCTKRLVSLSPALLLPYWSVPLWCPPKKRTSQKSCADVKGKMWTRGDAFYW